MGRVRANRGSCLLLRIERLVEVEPHKKLDIDIDKDVPCKEKENDGECYQGARSWPNGRVFSGQAHTHDRLISSFLFAIW